MNCKIPDVQDGFRKGKGTRDQIANICWNMEKAREFQKNIYFCFIDYNKPFDCVKWSCSVVSDSAIPWTVVCQAPLSMGFSRQECWSGLSFPSAGNLPNPGIEPGSPALQAESLVDEPRGIWLCGSQQTVENSERDGNTRPPDLPPEKFVCMSKCSS